MEQNSWNLESQKESTKREVRGLREPDNVGPDVYVAQLQEALRYIEFCVIGAPLELCTATVLMNGPEGCKNAGSYID